MTSIPESIASLSQKNGFVRSSKYDQAWMFDNSMGPSPLWLLESLVRDMNITKDMVVLDMGCGKALTSIFLAKEFGCTVFANDLWIDPDENLKRIKEHSLQSKVFPIHAEAHALPYAKEFFDAVTCIDSYNYYGTDDLYLNYFSKFIKPGGQIGIVDPGWVKETTNPMPPGLESFSTAEFASFHSADWWRNHFSKYGLVEIEKCGNLPNGKSFWRDSARGLYETKSILRSNDGTSPEARQKELDFWKEDIDFIEADKEDNIALIRTVARRSQQPGSNRSA